MPPEGGTTGEDSGSPPPRYPYQAMFTIIGIVVALVAIMVGYMMHGGNFGVLIQINEFIILGGRGHRLPDRGERG